mmetsp:Transcript_36245/g.64859  ORF Transcript_36245/g.64859 Transcript_36245/m.64859 type:complete len:331 (+) Transcript_36245:151-1143(+)
MCVRALRAWVAGLGVAALLHDHLPVHQCLVLRNLPSPSQRHEHHCPGGCADADGGAEHQQCAQHRGVVQGLQPGPEDYPVVLPVDMLLPGVQWDGRDLSRDVLDNRCGGAAAAVRPLDGGVSVRSAPGGPVQPSPAGVDGEGGGHGLVEGLGDDLFNTRGKSQGGGRGLRPLEAGHASAPDARQGAPVDVTSIHGQGCGLQVGNVPLELCHLWVLGMAAAKVLGLGPADDPQCPVLDDRPGVQHSPGDRRGHSCAVHAGLPDLKPLLIPALHPIHVVSEHTQAGDLEAPVACHWKEELRGRGCSVRRVRESGCARAVTGAPPEAMPVEVP